MNQYWVLFTNTTKRRNKLKLKENSSLET